MKDELDRERRLRWLGITALNMLEGHEEWNRELLDRLADAAYDLDLAETNEDGEFRKKIL